MKLAGEIMGQTLIPRKHFYFEVLVEEPMLVHKVCNSQLVRVPNKPLFCEVCNRPVTPDEVLEVDNSPSPFSG